MGEPIAETTNVASQKVTRSELLMLLFILLVASGLRIANINTNSFNMDEVHEVLVAHRSLSEVIHAPDSMPPLFPILLKGCVELFGSDLAGRWFSVVIGVLNIVVLWLLGREMLDKNSGLWAGALGACSPFLIFYSQHARGYNLYILLGTLCLWLLMRAVATQKTTLWIAFILASVAGIYTHYYFPMFLSFFSVVMFWRKKSFHLGRGFWISTLVIILFSIPVLPLMAADLKFQVSLRASRPLDITSFGYTYFSFFSGYTLGPSKPDLQTLSKTELLKNMLPWVTLVGLLLLTLGGPAQKRLRKSGWLVPIILLALGPVLLAGNISNLINLLKMLLGQEIEAGSEITYNIRHIAWCVIPVILALAAGAPRHLKNKTGLASISLLFLISGWAYVNRHYVPRYQVEDMRAVAHLLDSKDFLETSEPVYVVSDYQAFTLRHYIHPARPLIRLPDPNRDSIYIRTAQQVAQAITTLEKSRDKSGRIWLVYSRPFHGDPAGLFLREMNTKYKQIKTYPFAGVKVYLYENKKDSNPTPKNF